MLGSIKPGEHEAWQDKLMTAGRLVPVKKWSASEENNYFIEKVNFALDMRLDIKAGNHSARFFANQEQNTTTCDKKYSIQARIACTRGANKHPSPAVRKSAARRPLPQGER